MRSLQHKSTALTVGVSDSTTINYSNQYVLNCRFLKTFYRLSRIMIHRVFNEISRRTVPKLLFYNAIAPFVNEQPGSSLTKQFRR